MRSSSALFSPWRLWLLTVMLLVTAAVAAGETKEGPAKTKEKKKKATDIPPGISYRVVGGEKVTKTNKYPFFVEWEDAKCGGSLIHDDIVLSAAHCENGDHPFDARVFMLGIESETGIFRTVERQVSHPLYDPEGKKDYDYMILKLHKSALVDDEGKPTGTSTVELNKDRNVPQVGQALQAMGYGLTDEESKATSDFLNEATIYYIDDDVCRSQYGSTNFVPDLMFCGGVPGGGVDTCQGDSGGPIIAKDSGKQVGVVSYGIGCAREEYAGVSARVSSMTDWIEEQICVLSSFPPPGCASVGNHRPMGEGNGDLTIHVQQDSYPVENAWSFTYDKTQEQLFFQPFHNDVEDGALQEETFSGLTAGLYQMRMADDGDDGMCCEFGSGKVWITDDNAGQTVYENNGKFGTYFEVWLKIDESGKVSLEEEKTDYVSTAEKEPTVRNYPQRVDQDFPGPKPESSNSINVVVKFDSAPQETSWELAQETAPGVWTPLDSFDGAMEGVYSDEVVTPFTGLTAGWYRFSITDKGGNGICCDNRRGWVTLNAYLLATRRSGMAWASSGEFGSGTEIYLQMNSEGLINRVSDDPASVTG